MELSTFFETIDDSNNRRKAKVFIDWISETYPNLTFSMKWNQPMFLNEGTYIIGLSVSKKHLALGLEKELMNQLHDLIDSSNYESSKMLIKISWNKELDFVFLKKIVDYVIDYKKDIKSFWI
ncbi:MAG: DUF1801 domain-containing protein [Candidatus Izemoplasmatales bacterium]|nr:DUF1801 domain-containing protein [Candidatus Izemoplasmatales bacterium]